jgi:hypothetical protein
VSASRCILSPEFRSLLASFARRRLLVALDFDGVLAPLDADARAAQVPATTGGGPSPRHAVSRQSVISGRWRGQLVDRLPDVPFARLIATSATSLAITQATRR